ncbi:family 1 glycosylhydrolase [Streptococcus suivaginalis]|uniref:family 1 glycosylhydrolase n=1 Tax=Streptococcus suivaginalis TaxID=3028082 RepID=UPI0037DA20E4
MYTIFYQIQIDLFYLALFFRYTEDIAIFIDLGFKAFCTSIAWSRIFPTGFETEPKKTASRYGKAVFMLSI